MAKGAYVGVSNVARKIKKGYIGIDGVARKIKRAYIGIGGLARPCWSGGEVVYYGLVSGIYYERNNMNADSNSHYAFFGGGESGSGIKYYVDAYNSSLTRTNPENLTSDAYGASHVGDYVLFFGQTGYSSASIVEAYDYSAVHIICEALPTYISGASTFNKNYAIIGGGRQTTGYTGGLMPTNLVYAYNSSLSCIVAPTLSNSCGELSGGNVKEYAIFAGTAGSKCTCAYDGSLSMKSIETLSAYMNGAVSASVGDYVLFTGGENGSSVNTVEGYNSGLTLISAPNMTESKSLHAAITVEDYVIIGGGETGSGSPKPMSNKVLLYDAQLTKSDITSLSSARRALSAARIGNFALFAGGYRSDGYNEQNVDAYTIK